MHRTLFTNNPSTINPGSNGIIGTKLPSQTAKNISKLLIKKKKKNLNTDSQHGLFYNINN